MKESRWLVFAAFFAGLAEKRDSAKDAIIFNGY